MRKTMNADDAEKVKDFILNIFKKIPKGLRSHMSIVPVYKTGSSDIIDNFKICINSIIITVTDHDSYINLLIDNPISNITVHKDLTKISYFFNNISKKEILEASSDIIYEEAAKVLISIISKRRTPNNFIPTYSRRTNLAKIKPDQFNPKPDKPLLELSVNAITTGIRLTGIICLCDETFTISKTSADCDTSDKDIWFYFTAVLRGQIFNFISDGEVYYVIRDNIVVEKERHTVLTDLDKEMINDLIKQYIGV